MIALLLLAAVIDFTIFRSQIASLEPADTSSADAIVALTGGSGLRIAEGIRRLEAGEGARLLVSGVNRSTSREDVAATAGGSAETFDCCIDFGYEATTTRGNASEVAKWAGVNDYEVLTLVTSDYHLPRARLLLSDAAPDIAFLPAPVRTRIDPDKTFTDWRSFRGMVTEWAKWRVTQLVLLTT
ncbi:MAG: YdcF family protein [Pseudomonadota bacterium]